LELTLLGRGIDALQLDPVALRLFVAVDAHDHALAAFDLLLPVERRLLDLVLDEAALDRLHRAAEAVDLLDELPRARFQLVRQRLDEVRAAERVRGIECTAFARDELSRPKRDAV